MADQITTLLSAERRLLQDVSHELRSPLARLGFAVELAKTSPDREAALGRIHKEADRLNHLVDELLQLTRAEGDPGARNLEDVDLVELLQDLVADCALEADAQGCRLVLRGDRRVVVTGDRELLRRACENVLRNAIRHSPAGTTVDIEVVRHDGLAEISVRDHGTGVPREALSDIFEPFFRVEGDRDRSSGGVGLGLAIARRAVELHQGTVTAFNANPGLVVALELPCRTDRARRGLLTVNPHRPRATAGFRTDHDARPARRRTRRARAWRSPGRLRRGAGADRPCRRATGSSQSPGNTVERYNPSAPIDRCTSTPCSWANQ